MSLKSFRSRVGSAVRRSSLAFTPPRPSTPRSDSASDAGSIKQSQSDASSVAQMDTQLSLSPPTGLSVQSPSPIAESPAREAAAIAAEATGPSPLAQEVTESASDEPSSVPPNINEAQPTPHVVGSGSALEDPSNQQDHVHSQENEALTSGSGSIPTIQDPFSAADEATTTFKKPAQEGDGVDVGITTMPVSNTEGQQGATNGDATFAWGSVLLHPKFPNNLTYQYI
jgi:hypothetical protein